MTRPKRRGRTETFSVSVSKETKAQLKRAADRAYGGNVSALIEAIAVEAGRQEALDWLLDHAPPVDEQAYQRFLDEMEGRVPTKRRRRAA
jgi:post-segregation antitoxin (ccd killing protein)